MRLNNRLRNAEKCGAADLGWVDLLFEFAKAFFHCQCCNHRPSVRCEDILEIIHNEFSRALNGLEHYIARKTVRHYDIDGVEQNFFGFNISDKVDMSRFTR